MKGELTTLEQELLMCFRILLDDQLRMFVVQQIRALAKSDFSPQIMDFSITENENPNERYIKVRDEIQVDLDAYEEKRFRSLCSPPIKKKGKGI